jgi:hypothetical protein
MRGPLLFLSGFMMLLSAVRAPEVVTENYTGYAYGETTDNLLYTEEFTDKFNDGKHIETLTDYFDPKHKKIAQRVLDFRASKFAPDFELEDLRTGYLEGAARLDNKLRVFNRKDRSSKLEEKIIYIPEPVVVDGGFNQFLKANWSALENGETIKFYFAVPARLDYFTLRASRIDDNSDKDEMKIRVEPDKTLIRLLADPIIVRYSKATKRILSYHGQSNISDENGNNFMMRLVYPKKGP